MKIIGIILVIVGILGVVMGLHMYGDIGISCIVASVIGCLSGVGFILTSNAINKK